MKRFLALILIALLILSITACGDETPTTTHSPSVCSECQKECSQDASFCPSCGAHLLQKLICSKCNQENDPAAKFCSSCGNAFTSTNTDNSNTNNGNTDNDNTNSGNTDNGNTDSGNTDNGNTDNGNNDAIIQDVWLKTEETSSDFKTVYYYDSNGFLVAERMSYKSSGKFYSLTEYTNDDYGNPILEQITIATVSTLGSYNQYREITYTNQYDQNGNLISVTRNGSYTTTYAYDANGNLILETKSDGEKVEYEYDANGKLTSKSYISKTGNSYQKETYTYNENGQLAKTILSELKDEAEPLSSGTVPPLTQTPEDIVPDGGDNPAGGDDNSEETPVSNAPVEPEIPFSYYASAEPTPAYPTYPAYQYEYFYDTNGNIIKELVTRLDTNKTSTIDYQYTLLGDYCQQGKDKILPEEAGQFPEDLGSAGCDYCAGQGHDYCQGHTCNGCQGQGKQTCNGCHGTGKSIWEINGSDTCRVCYGSGKQICPGCDGSGKKFYS